MSLAERLASARRSAPRHVRAWDGPTRLFHWGLVALIVSAYLTRTYSNDPTLYWHRINGYSILALLLFRLMWGVVGSSTSRFASFFPWPSRVWRHAGLLLRGRAPLFLGHNPLGSVLIFVMLLAVLAQATAGLFTSDDVIAEGPLHKFASESLADRMGAYHAKGFWIILAFGVLHIAANLGYQFWKKEPVITAMVTGRKPVLDYADQQEAHLSPLWRAAACAVVAVALVVGGVMLAGDSVLR